MQIHSDFLQHVIQSKIMHRPRCRSMLAVVSLDKVDIKSLLIIPICTCLNKIASGI